MSGPTIPRSAPEPPAPSMLIDAHAHLDEYPDDELDRALGEIAGQRILFVEDAAQYPAQRRVFERFLAAAREQRKIVNLHTSGAEAEVLDLLRAYGIERAIVHWYAGPLDVLDGFVRHGAYFTVGVEVFTSRHIQEIARG